MHGANSDIDWLQRDLGVYIVNLFDTCQASRVLNFPRNSLAHLLLHYCKFEADKQYQLADWRIRSVDWHLAPTSQPIGTCSPVAEGKRKKIEKDKDCNLGFRNKNMHNHFQIQFERKLLKIFGPDMAHFLQNIWRIIVGIGFIQKFSPVTHKFEKLQK